MHPRSPKAECEKLLNELRPLAEKMLNEFGEFHPYGGYIGNDGEITHVGVQSKENVTLSAKDKHAILVQKFSELATNGHIMTAGIACNFLLRIRDEEVDAIKITLEDIDNYSVDICFPYKLGENGLLIFKPQAYKSQRVIFSDGGNRKASGR